MNAPQTVSAPPMSFASDNTGPVHPRVMEAVVAANEGHAMPYGADPIMEGVRERLRDLLGWPEAAVHLVATGTAGNALALACLAKPWSAVFCAPHAHVQEDECNAPEFYTGGAKLVPVDGPDGRMDPDLLRAAIAGEETRGVHGPQRGPVTVTQATERGTVYALADLAALREAAGGLPLHMDGARFANAAASLGATAAEMVEGFDAVTFGGTKNGLMGVEAVALRDPALGWEFELRRKRGAHLFSKHRFLSAQMAAYLEGDLWLETACLANAACARLAAGLRAAGADLVHEPQANMAFARFPRAAHRRLHDAGARYYLWDGAMEGDPEEPLTARLVCGWSTEPEAVDRFCEILAG